MKNCGKPVHEEVIKRSFLEEQKERIQGRVSQVVEFYGKEAKYRKTEDTDVFYLKKEKKNRKKKFQNFSTNQRAGN